MAEFYATYERNRQRFLAVVLGPERPVSLRFASRDELIEAMEALDQEWQLQSEVQLPDEYPAISADWLESMAEAGRMKQLPKPHGSLIGPHFG